MRSFHQVLGWTMGLVMFITSPSWAEIRIGQTAGFTGISAPGVKENTDGALLYLNAINAQGGINGQKIELISVDDQFSEKQAALNTKTLITEKQVIAMFLNRGTPHTQAMIPVLNAHKVPLIAPGSGAIALHDPVQPYVFNVRAPYQREVALSIEHLNLIGLTRLGLLYVNDTFGADVAVGAIRGFQKIKKPPVFQEKFDRQNPEFERLARQIFESDAQAVIVAASAQSASEAIKAIRATGSRAQIITLSNNSSQGFIKSLGDDGRGVIISQVFPNERLTTSPLIKEATQLAHAAGIQNLSPAMIEGFASAKVLVEGLRKAGKNPTAASLTSALNHLQNFDLGGLTLSYSERNHTGLQFVDLSIVSEKGKILR